MKRFQDQVVWITGASSGIGAALARELSSQGAHLVLAARRRDRLENLAMELRARGTRALVVECDVTREGDPERAVSEALREYGRLDVVVANAGFGVNGPFEKLRLEDYQRQFDTNVWGVIRTIHAALPELRKSRGRIGILGSVAGYVALPGSSPYSMSKFAIRAFTVALRRELRPTGVAVTHIAPGFVDSEIFQVDNRGNFHPDSPDFVPRWIRMPAPRAARQIARALAGRRKEVVVTAHGKVIVFLERHFHWLLDLGFTLTGLQARREPRGRGA